MISLRDFQDDKADVIVKYTPDEVRLRLLFLLQGVPSLLISHGSRQARNLKQYGELPDNAKVLRILLRRSLSNSG